MAAASVTFVRGNQIFVRADNVPSGAFLMDSQGNKSTDDSGSQRLTLANVQMFVKLLISAMPNAPNGTAIIPWMMLIVGIVRMAKKMDGIILRIGLNPALTGDPLGTRFPGMLTAMTLRNIAQMVPRTAATCFQNVWRAAVCTVGCFALWV